jgi:mannan endo-1,4-beta-mannosidase
MGSKLICGITAFTKATGIKPRVVVYYLGWHERFKVAFARTAANEGAVPLVQMNPAGTNIAAIAAGQYDNYLSTYANAVRAYHHQVILSFGHEMNGFWYSWGYTHTSPVVFVAAWRHIVTVFRARGAQNVTWL